MPQKINKETTPVKTFETHACFLPGTLVNIPNGFKKIEDISAGDYVLSKPESGAGETCYKKVIRTLSKKNQKIYSVRYVTENYETGLLFVTAEHPFWVVGKGWTALKALKYEEKILLSNGKEGFISCVYKTFETEIENVFCYTNAPQSDDISNSEYCYAKTDDCNAEYISYELDPQPDPLDMKPLYANVHNIEVEDYHTYFVSGVWVHNADCRVSI